MKTVRSGWDSSLTSKLYVTVLQRQSHSGALSQSYVISKRHGPNTSPLWLRNSGKLPFLPGGNCHSHLFFFFFLIVPKTKILATGGASHNRDILQVSAGSRPCTGTSSVSVTSQSQTRDNKNCLCSQGYRDGGLTACPLPGSQLRHLTVHIVSRFCLIHR